MKLDLRIAASAAGILIAAGAVVGGVALAAAPSSHHSTGKPAAPSTTAGWVSYAPLASTGPAYRSTLTITTSAPTSERKPAKPSATRTHRVAPKEQPVSSQSSQPVQSQPSSSPAGGGESSRAGNPPVLPQPSPPPVTVPNGYSGAADPTDSPSD